MEKALDMGKYMIHFYRYQVYFAVKGRIPESGIIVNNADCLAKFIGYFSLLSASEAKNLMDTELDDIEKDRVISDIKQLIDAIRENSRRIIYDENYIDILGSYFCGWANDGTEKDKPFKVAPEVSLIYACSLMGDKNITKELFDLNLEELMIYTTKVRKMFLDSNLGSFQSKTTLTGKHFKH